MAEESMKRHYSHMTKINLSLFSLILLISTSAIARVTEPSFTTERAIFTYKINADATYELIEEVTTRINTQKTANDVPDDQLPYNAGKESIKVVEAYTILPTGEHIAVTKNNIHTRHQESSSSHSSIDDDKVIDIIYPQVTAGSKTYYKAITKIHKTTFKNQFSLLMSYDPTSDFRYVEYNIEFPKSLKVFVDSRDVKGGRLGDGKNGQVHYQFIYSHPYALSAEPYQIDSVDFAPFFHLSTYENPLAFGHEFEKASQSKSLVTKDIQALADKITLGITDDYQQAKAIYNWISKEIRYVGDFMGENDYASHEATYVLHKRFGDCKDHNNLLITLLKAKNIQAGSALIGAGNNYKLTKLGDSHPFDHVITYLPKWDLYADSTIGLAPFGQLSNVELDKPTVLTSLNKIGHTRKFAAADEQIIDESSMQIQADGTIKGTTETHFKGTKEIAARTNFSSFEGEEKQNTITDHLARYRESGTGTYTPGDVYDLNKPFTVSGTFTLDPISNIPGNGAITIPIGLSKGAINYKGEVRPDETAEFPFMCQSAYLEENTQLTFPSNVKVTKIPVSVAYVANGINYQTHYALKDNAVTVKRSLGVERPSVVCGSKDLENWKVFHKVLKHDLRSQIIYE